MASMAAFVYFWSSAYEVSGGCATDTLYPSFLRMLATASQPEPSANAPCTRTTFLMPLGGAAAATVGAFSSSSVAPISVAATVAITYSFFMTILLCSFNRGDIAFGRVEAVLAGHHLAPF